MAKITPFLMFEGRAEDAMNFYLTVFDNAEIVSLSRYGAGGPGAEGTVFQAVFSLNGQTFMCTDSFVKHSFTFTPSLSLYVSFDREEEIDRAYALLSEGGGVMMPLAAYPFSPKFCWVSDKFGVSWQLSLTGNQ